MACHGANAVSVTPLTPSLAAQPAVYITAQLSQFVAGKRKSDVMAPMAKTVAPADVRALAEALEKLPPPPSASSMNESTYRRGKSVAEMGQCDTCHQPDFSGIDNAPRLAHQREDYLAKALGDFKSGARLGYGEPIMPAIAAGLSDDDIRAVAHYLAHFSQK